MANKCSEVEKMYDSVSKEYVQEFSGEHKKKPKDQEILHRFSQAVGNKSPVWDLGCGPGHTTKYLKNLGVEISGLDLSERFIEQAGILHPEIHFLKGNILNLEFADNSIAAVLSFYAIVHFTKDQVREAFNEIFRVLIPKGLFLFTYHIGEETLHIKDFLGKKTDIDFMFFTTDQIADYLNTCGFNGIETIERDPYPEVEYQSRRAYVFATKP